MSKRQAPTVEPLPADESDTLKITPLGGGNEVGRSCILLEFKQKKVNCGLHPAYSGLAALPFFDEIDPSEIDLLLVSHFHIDHAAAVPYFMQKTNFKGKVYMTHPTRAIYKWMLSDYVKVSNLSTEDMLYTEQDLLKSYDRIQVVDYHQEVDVDGIRFTSYNAGHVLGAAMFLIEIAGIRVFYTGDYSREEDRHLMAAERPKNVVPEVLICESTYGVQSHQPRVEREAMFTSMVHKVVGQQSGRCLIPVFALGRAQELLLILDEYWQQHSELHQIPIYYASNMAKKCMSVYQTYTNMMNEKIKKQIKTNNPFQFKHISNLRSVNNFDDVGPCVMFASPGFLQSGLSRELLELWCGDKRNGVIIPGYVVDGTLAKEILSEPKDFKGMSGARLPLNLSVEYISFSAHVDYQQNSQFIEEVAAPNLILVHGEANQMGRLRKALEDKYHEREQPLKICTPRNCEVVELHFRGEKMAKQTLGSLAEEFPIDEELVEGVLVSRDYQYNIIDPMELNDITHSKLHLTSLKQKQVLKNMNLSFNLLKWNLENLFGKVEAFETVIVTKNEDTNELYLEWEGNSVNDMISDSILALCLQAEISPASVKCNIFYIDFINFFFDTVTRGDHNHSHSNEEVSVKDEESKEKFTVKIEEDELEVENDLSDNAVNKDDDKKHVELVFLSTLLLEQQFGKGNVEFKIQSVRESEDDVKVKVENSDDFEDEKEAKLLNKFFIKYKDCVNMEKIKDVCDGYFKIKVDGELCLLYIKFLIGFFDCFSENEVLNKRILNIGDRIFRSLSPVLDTWDPS
ncbi:Cleavage and polyadenylation specificity factor subunit 3 [Clydaea vesicula]|uniref:Endoribonuclease YSH1 n=1 Tax=Clydaea vesicula TaxID=447962 RepID=A0AAD5U600_9FUNG|nr:Cleavage and polyadenylation specificity factor subunit 3 [Clydaea vesicula]